MSGVMPLFPPMCLHGMYRDTFTFLYCVQLVYFVEIKAIYDK